MKIADLKPVLFPTKTIQVDKNLFRGNAVFSPIKAIRLKKKGVSQVIDLRHENNFIVKTLQSLEKLYCNLLNINYVQKTFYIDKHEIIPNADYFKNLNEQINKSDKTYLHCHFGKHRTGFAVAMYQKSKNVPENKIFEQLNKIDWGNVERQNLLKKFLHKFFNK